MSASEMGFSSSRDIVTRRRCPTHSGERPKCHGHARHAHRSTLGRVVAGYLPPYKNLHVPPARDAQAEPPRRVWVGRLRGWGISNLYQSLGNPILSF
jgi:hypothetical protein